MGDIIYWKKYDEPIEIGEDPIFGKSIKYGEWECNTEIVKSFSFYGHPFLDSDEPIRLTLRVELLNGKFYEDVCKRNEKYEIVNGREPYQFLVDEFEQYLLNLPK